MTDQRWLDDQAGPVVRPYAVTRGRARPVTCQFDLIAYVIARPGADDSAVELQPEHRMTLRKLKQGPITVAELASQLDLAVGVVRVILGDLLAGAQIRVHAPNAIPHQPNDRIIEAVIDGIRSL
jgi:hypothetical protein